MNYSDKILKASNVKKAPVIYSCVSEALSTISALKYVKIYNGRIKASNLLSRNGKNEPITDLHQDGITGIELLIDCADKTIQFYSIQSSEKGAGEKMVSSVISSVPEEWRIIVFLDWSGGFWDVMKERYPRLVLV